MQDLADYQRGLEAARADAKQGWARCWMPARQLAEEAVYCPRGLSPEQLGYAAGLDECFPGGLDEISSFLGRIQGPGPVLVLRPDGWLDPAPAKALARPVDTLVRVASRWHGQQFGNVYLVPVGAAVPVTEPALIAEKRAFLARFV